MHFKAQMWAAPKRFFSVKCERPVRLLGRDVEGSYGLEYYFVSRPAIDAIHVSDGNEHMKTLLILRHAKSSWKDESVPDHDRPLNKRGRRDAPRMGEILRQEGFQPDLVLSSDAVRARDTTRLALEAAGFDGEVEYRESLYAFEPGAYLQALSRLDDAIDQVLIIGHNPALEELLSGLTGEHYLMPTAALAHLELPVEHWSQISFGMRARLANLWRPKEV